MFDRLRIFFERLASPPTGTIAADDPRISVMALCIHVMEADGQVLDSERRLVRSLIKDHYDLDEGSLTELMAAGQSAESESVDFYRFTSEIKRHLTEEERIDLVGMLWEIVYADGQRSELEDHVIWRIADLLGVSGRDRIIKRQEVAARMGEVEETESERDV